MKKEDLFTLQPIKTLSMADRVEAQLHEYIIKRAIRPGEPIPKEQELAEALGVSRNVVREAISRLRMFGLIDSRKKRGMVLAQPDILKGLAHILNPRILNSEVRKQLFELRLVLEVGLGDLIFKRKNPEWLKKLEAIVESERVATTKVERIRCELDFHSTLYELGGNDTITRFQNILMPVFEYVVEYESKLEHTAVGRVTHADLVKILHDGDPSEFPNAMRSHLQPHFAQL